MELELLNPLQGIEPGLGYMAIGVAASGISGTSGYQFTHLSAATLGDSEVYEGPQNENLAIY